MYSLVSLFDASHILKAYRKVTDVNTRPNPTPDLRKLLPASVLTESFVQEVTKVYNARRGIGLGKVEEMVSLPYKGWRILGASFYPGASLLSRLANASSALRAKS